MKKSILFVIAVAVMSLASCKKDRTCTCVTSGGGFSGTDIQTESHLTKKEAKRVLKCYSGTYTESGVIVTQTCTLK